MKAPDMETEETWPPPPMRPVATPALGKSLSVDTVMPVALPSEGGPMVTPNSVTVMEVVLKACWLLTTVKTMDPGVGLYAG